MWNKDRSVILSQVSTRVIMALGLLLALALPFFGRLIIAPDNIFLLVPIYYAFCVPAYIALCALDRLLAAIKRDEVFTARNVRYLRIISWACFAAAFVLLISSIVAVFGNNIVSTFGLSATIRLSTTAPIILLALGILATFFGITMRVVKNLFAAAVDIKTENDFTI